MFITPSGWIPTLLYVAGILAVVYWLCFLCKRFRLNPLLYLLAMIIYVVAAVYLARLFMAKSGFDFFRLFGFGCFLGGTTLLGSLAWVAWTCKYKFFGAFLGIMCLVSFAVSVDATIIEPLSLETRFEKITTDKITKPVRIAIVADIQTDDFGGYERSALLKVMQQKPDLILMAGDYLQCYTAADFRREEKDFRDAMKEVGWKAPLGVYAVQGDIEVGGYDDTRRQNPDIAQIDWTKTFDGFPVTIIPELKTIELDEIAITGLSLWQSRAHRSEAPKIDNKYHIVFGHNPNFMLGTTADLLIAGHTHGGQVQVPNHGPLMTYSDVPRNWGAGCHIVTKDGSHAIISRGIGMERLDAPRLRFFCHPEIVICDVLPAQRKSTEKWRDDASAK